MLGLDVFLKYNASIFGCSANIFQFTKCSSNLTKLGNTGLEHHLLPILKGKMYTIPALFQLVYLSAVLSKDAKTLFQNLSLKIKQIITKF